MKIKAFSKIDNALSYSFFDWNTINPPMLTDRDGVLRPSNAPFAKSNIIFGENGNGKSKLVDILKSLDENSSQIDKHRDRKVDGQEIKINVDGGRDVEFMTSWSHDDWKNKFLFFDKKFINRYVHSTGADPEDTAQRKQQRGRDIIYLGNFAAYNDEIERVDGLRDKIKERNDLFIKEEEVKITALLESEGLTIDQALGQRKNIAGVEESEIGGRKEALPTAETDLAKLTLSIRDKHKVAELKLPSEIKDMFSLEIADRDNNRMTLEPSKLFEFTVARGVATTIHKIEHKKEFIKRGLSLITDTSTECPFCEQTIKTDQLLQIIQDYQQVFDETFEHQEERVVGLIRSYKSILIKLRDIRAPQGNHQAIEALKPFETPVVLLPVLELSEEEKSILNAEIELLIKKEENVLGKIDRVESNEIPKILKDVNLKITEYNEAVKLVIGQIEKLKSEAGEGKLEDRKIVLTENIKALKLDIFLLLNKKAFDAYTSAEDKYKSNLEVIEGLDRIFKSLKGRIVAEFNSFATVYFELIAEYVKEMSPAMKILDISGQPTYDQRSTRDPAQCGFRVTYNKQDYLGNLSEGEKQVIALAFFFARLAKETDKDKIIVLDDPITSFDTGKRKSAAHLIQKATEEYSQLFVLTCDPLFREYLLKEIPDNRNFYHVLKSAGSSAIHYAPAKRETIYSHFEDEFRDIHIVLGTNENVVIYGQKLRFCLETKIREDYFGASEDNLSNMIKKVTGHGREKFEKLFDNRDKVLDIYSYCNTGGLAHYPKDGATSWNELTDKINEYLALDL